jgi:protein involved in polysaccharide export with SLBB domain
MSTPGRSLRLALAAVVGATLSACAPHPLPRGTPGDDSVFLGEPMAADLLGPNDQVRVEVFGHPEFSTAPGGVRVTAEGELPVGQLGALPAGGRTVPQLRAAVEKSARRYLRSPVVNVEVLTWRSQAIYVFGAMEGGGQFFLDRPLTALQALSLGGKFREGADRCRVVLLRQHEDRMAVWEFNAVTADERALVPVRSGDILFVRLSGAGRFREQIMPYIQSFSNLAGAASAMRNTGTWWDNSGG